MPIGEYDILTLDPGPREELSTETSRRCMCGTYQTCCSQRELSPRNTQLHASS